MVSLERVICTASSGFFGGFFSSSSRRALIQNALDHDVEKLHHHFLSPQNKFSDWLRDAETSPDTG